MAIGVNSTVDSGLTNAIVIGVPHMVPDAARRNEGILADVPKAVKSNSINLVYHGNGLDDFFVDNVPMSARIASEVKVVGNGKSVGKASDIEDAVNELVGITNGEEHVVFVSGNGGIKMYTKSYLDALDSGDT